MITNDQITSTIDYFKERGYSVRVRDISYAILCSNYEDYNAAYRTVWGEATAKEINTYNTSEMMVELRSYMIDYLLYDDYDEKEDISFDENKAYMLKLRRDTEKAMRLGEIDKKDALQILKDISVKLNDKFSVADDSKDNTVIVNHKFNDICPYCRHEIERAIEPMSKEEAMAKYNLIENTNK